MSLTHRRAAVSQPSRTRMVGFALLVALSSIAAGCGGSAISPREAVEANAAIVGSGSAKGSGVGGTSPTQNTDAPLTGTNGNVVEGSPGATTSGGPAVAANGSQTSGSHHALSGGGLPQAGFGVARGSCNGFKNQVGVTNSTITVGNEADLSGPIPGLFASAEQAVAAYVAYFNATNPTGICGRKLVLDSVDSRTDAGAEQQSTQAICEHDFAAVGSLSAFDGGGAQSAQSCGLPDIRAFSTQLARNACSTCYGVQPISSHLLSTAIFSYWVQHEKAATQKAALIYLNAGAAVDQAKLQLAVGKRLGMNWVYTTSVDVADFNYSPYVQQLKSKGVEFVYYIGAYQQSVRWAQAMQTSGYTPKVAYYTPGIYDRGFIGSGGGAVEGATTYLSFTPLEQRQPELDLYKQWLNQVAPGAAPSFYGVFAWSAAMLFTEKALALGGKLNRATLLNAIRSTNGWTGGGMHAPMSVGAKIPPSCVRFVKVQHGMFVPADTGKYTCSGTTSD